MGVGVADVCVKTTPASVLQSGIPVPERKGTLASPAVALAIRVLPVPGGPVRTAPWGGSEYRVQEQGQGQGQGTGTGYR